MDSTIDEAKYYTPEFKEFHPGFRFELLYPNTGLWERKWIKEDKPNLRATKVNLEKGRIRVKKLDREDIESLGWVLDQCVKRECFFYHKDESIMTKTNFCLCWDEEAGEISFQDTNNYSSFSFCGIIRNKSELKNQLERCGIKTKKP